MSKLNVELGSRSYPILIQADILNTKHLLSEFVGNNRLVVVSNETVAPLYLKRLSDAISAPVESVIIPDGEQFKNLTQLESVIGKLLAKGCGRDTTLIALGGGVVGDLCGFVAATYQRGIPFIQVPTTLLSQVDSSVGGKTAVNHALGKNMIGAFYQPKAVIIDTMTLSTLPAKEFAAGMAEVIKYGIIYDSNFFCWLEANATKLTSLDPDALNHAIHRCCAIKAEIVSNDEREKGQRALLNLGHTFGHAIEAEMGYGNWLHGEAVAAGMVIACRVAEQLNWMDSSEVRRLINLLQSFELPVSGPESMDFSAYMQHMQHDKKVEAGSIRFVIPTGIGNAVVTSEISEQLLQQVLG
ncbi:3-dehydroquinate synthase [Alteromonas sediminis]|uniref:3-dehydroquinate synthase n=1 Tax=Alteromonas sediminis TaxID=2259342 RepID=A0A3N5XZA2_9ALTE|nr:3-dehydroquinate synthase [Alteromonas sediminis]RPJ66372.1 3-dehydroquinate synthase [Alteromonas sediminis]